MSTHNLLSADRATFAKALSFAKRAVERRNTVPILANVQINATGNHAMIHATDLDRRILVKVPLKSRVSKTSLTLPAYPLDDVTKKAKASETITITPLDDGDKAAVHFGNLKITMDGLPVADFPDLPHGEVLVSFEMDSAVLLQALERVRFAISTEETRYYLNGVYMHVEKRKLRFVSTDGHRLAVADTKLPKGAEKMQGLIIPRLTVDDLIAMLKRKDADEVTIIKVTDDNNGKLEFSNGDITIISKVVDGTFPDYYRVIPTNNNKLLTVTRQKLFDAVKEVSCVAEGRGRAVRFNMRGNKLTASVSNPNLGTAERTITVEYNSDPLDIGFNSSYVLDIMNTMESDEMAVKLADAGSPAIFNGDPGFFAVLMPMRV